MNHALLLTDVVDSTKLSEQLGDAAMARVWAARDLLRAHAGREIDKTDGFLLLFDDAASRGGLRCGPRPLEVERRRRARRAVRGPRRHREAGDRRAEGKTHALVGALQGEVGRVDEARGALDAGERTLREIQDVEGLVKLLCNRLRIEVQCDWPASIGHAP